MTESHEKTADRYDRIDQRLGESLTEIRGLGLFDYTASHVEQELTNVRDTVRAAARKHRQAQQGEDG